MDTLQDKYEKELNVFADEILRVVQEKTTIFLGDIRPWIIDSLFTIFYRGGEVGTTKTLSEILSAVDRVVDDELALVIKSEILKDLSEKKSNEVII